MGVVQWGVSGGAHGSGPMGRKWRGTWEWSNGEKVEGHMGVVQWGESGGAHGSGPMGCILMKFADLLVFLHILL